MKPDYQIAQEAELRPIMAVAEELGIDSRAVIPYGHDKAKLKITSFDAARIKASRLILVTAITPNKAGVGKTLTSVSLAQGLRKLGKNVVLALREPSLGPCFGMKGGAAGGGYAQVVPMEDINLHFTGDFHAITSANNTLAALADNYRYTTQGKPESLKSILFKRVLDVNDRSLRYILSGLNGSANGIPTETGFDITPASELMAVLCLSQNMEDLRTRLGNILLGYTYDNAAFTARDLGVEGAITALMRDALFPNLVQTLEGGAALVHGGPFANIAHGCNSLMATKTAMQYGDYVVTEAGFGSDLGAEKFFNIKCRIGEIQPAMSVLVVSTQALKINGGVPEKEIQQPHLAGLQKGLMNLERHLANLYQFGQKVLVSLNRYHFDTEEELAYIRSWCQEQGAHFGINEGFTKGGIGAMAIAEQAVSICESPSPAIQHTYELTDSLETKITKIIQKVYKGEGFQFGKQALSKLKKIKGTPLENLPVCMAKTQYSFTDNPAISGLQGGFELSVEDLVVNQGAGFIVAVCGEMMRMPGLPKVPAAHSIDVVEGKIVGLS
jgi:formate--tetrahydrofolate ligase